MMKKRFSSAAKKMVVCLVLGGLVYSPFSVDSVNANDTAVGFSELMDSVLDLGEKDANSFDIIEDLVGVQESVNLLETLIPTLPVAQQPKFEASVKVIKNEITLLHSLNIYPGVTAEVNMSTLSLGYVKADIITADGVKRLDFNLTPAEMILPEDQIVDLVMDRAAIALGLSSGTLKEGAVAVSNFTNISKPESLTPTLADGTTYSPTPVVVKDPDEIVEVIIDGDVSGLVPKAKVKLVLNLPGTGKKEIDYPMKDYPSKVVSTDVIQKSAELKRNVLSYVAKASGYGPTDLSEKSNTSIELFKDAAEVASYVGVSPQASDYLMGNIGYLSRIDEILVILNGKTNGFRMIFKSDQDEKYVFTVAEYTDPFGESGGFGSADWRSSKYTFSFTSSVKGHVLESYSYPTVPFSGWDLNLIMVEMFKGVGANFGLSDKQVVNQFMDLLLDSDLVHYKSGFGFGYSSGSYGCESQLNQYDGRINIIMRSLRNVLRWQFSPNKNVVNTVSITAEDDSGDGSLSGCTGTYNGWLPSL